MQVYEKMSEVTSINPKLCDKRISKFFKICNSFVVFFLVLVGRDYEISLFPAFYDQVFLTKLTK
jgi:hypothetical protein